MTRKQKNYVLDQLENFCLQALDYDEEFSKDIWELSTMLEAVFNREVDIND